MALNSRWFRLGRLFMVAWLAFYPFPVIAVLQIAAPLPEKAIALGLLLGSALAWAWYWLRVAGGPDRRFAPVALAVNGLLLAAFTLLTPPKYGSLLFYLAVMAASAFRWRVSVPLAIVVAVVAGTLDVIRGVSVLQASGDVINDSIVGLSVVAGGLLIASNQQLSMAREQMARLAVGEERLRFARDLHDLLGHSLSVIALKSELAGRLMQKSPDLATREVKDIEKVARDALREVRETVTGYRQPTLSAELAGAREALTAAGIECCVEQQHRTLPPVLESILAWTVREGATNVIRHSQARRCTVRLSSRDDQVMLDIVDDGRGGNPVWGSGLRGLEERVGQRGGHLTAGALPHEGFRLQVALPLGAGHPADHVPA